MEASPDFAQAVFDRTPPFSLEAETAVLGGMLIDREAVTRAIEHLNESMFYREANRRLYRAMVRLYERGDVIDVITLYIFKIILEIIKRRMSHIFMWA